MTKHEQTMAALTRANQIRLARVDLRRRIGAGEITVAEVLDPDGEIPPEAEGMTFAHLLTAQRRWGRKRALTYCRRIGISEIKPLRDLTVRQRNLVVAAPLPSILKESIAA